MPFGLSRKNKDADPSSAPDPTSDSARAALFSKRGKASASSNPYAATPPPQGGNDPYAAPPAYPSSNPDAGRAEKTPVPVGGYGAGAGGYGGQGGYGGNRYGAEDAGGSAGPARRAGGYGGMGGGAEDDGSRDALFGGAAKRAQNTTGAGGGAAAQGQGQTQGGAGGSTWGGGEEESSYGGYGTGSNQGYGSYADRQLTAEEEEEEDVQATKQQIRQLKNQDVASTRNALRIAAQAEETGRSTLARLGEQGERIHNTEKNLDLASNQNRLAEDKARELKTLNKSMFAMHVNNPFTAGKRREARDQAIMDKHYTEREQREATRREAFRSQQRQAEYQRDLSGKPGQGGNAKNLAERSKYQFEADSEDDEMENEIEGNLDLLQGAAGRLGQLGRAMGREVDEQNKHIDRITGKTDTVDDQIAFNRARLDRIK
ncbi:MAG: Meiosis-specific subunit of the t-SNARE complex [Bathelium mastoideum]|nr:MAG: Meiosis-specific subunit of the t-SNARE complex [Bathelium mastoideum]